MPGTISAPGQDPGILIVPGLWLYRVLYRRLNRGRWDSVEAGFIHLPVFGSAREARDYLAEHPEILGGHADIWEIYRAMCQRHRSDCPGGHRDDPVMPALNPMCW